MACKYFQMLLNRLSNNLNNLDMYMKNEGLFKDVQQR